MLKRNICIDFAGWNKSLTLGQKQQQLLPHQMHQLSQSSSRKITFDKPIPISQLDQIQEDKNNLLTKNLLLPALLREAENHIQGWENILINVSFWAALRCLYATSWQRQKETHEPLYRRKGGLTRFRCALSGRGRESLRREKGQKQSVRWHKTHEEKLWPSFNLATVQKKSPELLLLY